MLDQVLELEYHGLLELSYRADREYRREVILEIHELHRMLAYFKVCQPPHESNALINNTFTKVYCELPHVEDLSFELLMSKKLVLLHGAGVAKEACNVIGGSSPSTHLIPAQTHVLYLTGGGGGGGGSALDGCLFLRRILCLGDHEFDFESRQLQLNLQSGRMKALRVLLLRDIKGLTELDGWEGVPELVQLELESLPDLRRIGVLGYPSTRLETLSIEYCRNLEVEVLVGDDHNDESKKKKTSRSSLVKVSHHFPKLQVLIVRANRHLVELGSTFSDTFPALKILGLSDCNGLERLPHDLLPKLGRSLRSLDLSRCDKLKSIFEGGEYNYSLPALQYLNLSFCGELERFPDLSSVVDLRELDTYGCDSLLHEVRLNMRSSACKHLKRLHLWKLNCRANDGSSRTSILSLLADAVLCDVDRIQLRSGSVSAAGNGINPFSNLQYLTTGPTWNYNTRMRRRTPETSCRRRLDVSRLPSLEFLEVASIEWVQELSISLSSLVRLVDLKVTDCPILEKISLDGHGAHHDNLERILIEDCPLLKSAPDSVDSLDSLKSLFFGRCAALKDVSNLAALATSLTRLKLKDCPALTDVSIVAALTSLEKLTLQECTALTRVPDLKHLLSLKELEIDAPTPPGR